MSENEKKTEPKAVRIAELSAEAQFALTMSVMWKYGMESPQGKDFLAGFRQVFGVSFVDSPRSRWLGYWQKGADELIGRGILEAEKNGEGVWVFKNIHDDLVIRDFVTMH